MYLTQMSTTAGLRNPRRAVGPECDWVIMVKPPNQSETAEHLSLGDISVILRQKCLVAINMIGTVSEFLFLILKTPNTHGNFCWEVRKETEASSFLCPVTPVINQRPEPPLNTHTPIHTTVNNGARRHCTTMAKLALMAAVSLFLTLWFWVIFPLQKGADVTTGSCRVSLVSGDELHSLPSELMVDFLLVFAWPLLYGVGISCHKHGKGTIFVGIMEQRKHSHILILCPEIRPPNLDLSQKELTWGSLYLTALMRIF